MSDFVVRPITSQATLPLRMAVLRQGLGREASIFPGDDDRDTRHLGAFVDEKLVGIASLYRAELPPRMAPENAENEQAWQLRGMAVDPDAQGRGYGKVILKACVDHVARRGGTLLWCNARMTALEFYRSLKFQTRGDEFIIPTAGPHMVMFRRLEAHGEQARDR